MFIYLGDIEFKEDKDKKLLSKLAIGGGVIGLSVLGNILLKKKNILTKDKNYDTPSTTQSKSINSMASGSQLKDVKGFDNLKQETRSIKGYSRKLKNGRRVSVRQSRRKMRVRQKKLLPLRVKRVVNPLQANKNRRKNRPFLILKEKRLDRRRQKENKRPLISKEQRRLNYEQNLVNSRSKKDFGRIKYSVNKPTWRIAKISKTVLDSTYVSKLTKANKEELATWEQQFKNMNRKGNDRYAAAVGIWKDNTSPTLNTSGARLLIGDDGEIKAVAHVARKQYGYQNYKEKTFLFDALSVSPKALWGEPNSKGAGITMIARIAQEAKDAGYKALAIDSYPITAKKFYQDLGFKSSPRDDSALILTPDLVDELLMRYKAAIKVADRKKAQELLNK